MPVSRADFNRERRGMGCSGAAPVRRPLAKNTLGRSWGASIRMTVLDASSPAMAFMAVNRPNRELGHDDPGEHSSTSGYSLGGA